MIMTKTMKWDFDKQCALFQLLNAHICVIKNTSPNQLVIKFV